MKESPSLVARLGGPFGSQSKTINAFFGARAQRFGVIGKDAFGVLKLLGDYSDTTVSNWEKGNNYQTDVYGDTQLYIPASKPAFSKRTITFKITPDVATLTGYNETTSVFEVSKFTDALITNSSSVTHGSGTSETYPGIGLAGGIGVDYRSDPCAKLSSATKTVTWAGGNVTLEYAGVTSTAAVYQNNTDPTLFSISNTGSGWTYYADVEFTFYSTVVWENDYLYDDFLADAVALWDDLTGGTDFYTSSHSSRRYDDDGTILTSSSAPPAVGGGPVAGAWAITSAANPERRSDAPGGTYQKNSHLGTPASAGVNIGSGYVTITATRNTTSGEPALYVAHWTPNSPPDDSGIASIDTRESRLLAPGSSVVNVIKPTADDVTDLLSYLGCDYTLAWPADYTTPTPDWPKPA